MMKRLFKKKVFGGGGKEETTLAASSMPGAGGVASTTVASEHRSTRSSEKEGGGGHRPNTTTKDAAAAAAVVMHRDVFDDDEDEDEDDDDNMPKVLLDLGTRRTSMGDVVDDGYSSSSNNNNNTNNPPSSSSSAAAAASMTTTTTMNDDSANKRVSLMRRASSKMINCGTTGGNNNGGLATTPSNNSIGGNFIRNIHSDPIQQIESIIQYWEPPVHQKSKSDEEFITLALQRNFVFANALSDETISRKRELTLIVNAFEYYTVSEGGVTILDSTTVGDHFYILKEGSVDYMSSIDTTTTTTRSSSGRKKVKVGQASRPGQSFGELCLLYNCPPPADCVSGPKGEGQVALYNTSCNLWRIHKQTFRYIMALRTIRQDEWLRNAVRTKIDIFLGLDDDFINRIANAFDVRSVKCDEVIYRSGDKSDEYYIVGSGDGTVKITLDGSNNKNDNKKSLTKIIGSGEVFGIDAISGCGGHAPSSSSYQRAETAIATSATTLLVMSREQLDRTIGSLTDAKLVSRDRKLLKSIPLFRDSDFEDFEYELLAALIEPRTYKKKHIMYEEEDIINEPALYIVRDGTLEQLSDKFEDREKVLKEGDIFGEDSLLPDKTGKFGGPKGGQLYREETVQVISNVATCGKLTLSNIDSIILDLHRLGCNRRRNRSDPNVVGLKESILVKDSHPVMLEQLEYHQLFGAGTFGRVWIVSKRGDHKIAYALKIQSKRALLDHKQASSALRERMVMEKLDHPFLCRLVNTFQDNEHIYMLLSLIQGGELLNLIQGGESYGGLPEIATKFYAATIVEGLSYMHRRHIVYRDLKPDNVLVDSHGYAVIVDFGFAKVVRDKTYTFCGTPLYLAPEIVLARGHDRAVDYWSLGCLIYEMVYSTTPFYRSGIDQKGLFKSIATAKWRLPDNGSKLSKSTVDLIKGFLEKRPTERLGCLAGGYRDVKNHPFFLEVNFNKLAKKQINAPWIPQIDDPLDISNFEQFDDDEDLKKMKPLTPEEQLVFKSF